MSREDKIRTVQEGPGAQRYGQGDSKMRPTDDQDVRSVHGEQRDVFFFVRFENGG
jgi:hypothetical protein